MKFKSESDGRGFRGVPSNSRVTGVSWTGSARNPGARVPPNGHASKIETFRKAWIASMTGEWSSVSLKLLCLQIKKQKTQVMFSATTKLHDTLKVGF